MSPARALAVLVGVLLAAIAVVLSGLLVGVRPLRPEMLPAVLFAPDGRIESVLVWSLRLPRSLAAFAGGAGLATAGFILQAITRNPLAGPGLTGTTAGAVMPIAACFVFLPALSSVYYPFVGMVGALAAASVTFWIARGGDGRSLHLALGGISVSLFLGAITTFVILRSGPQASSLLFWLSGGFQGRSWSHLAYMLPWAIAGLAGALACQRILGLMALGEQAAAGMGLRLAVWKPVLLFCAVLPVAGVAPVAGPVAFVGLASPHIARLLRPPTPGWAVLLSAAIGGLMVVSADIVGRSIAVPREIPVSILTAVFGGPIFIYLVQRRSAPTHDR